MESEKIKILIVDDNTTYLKTLKEQLIRNFPDSIIFPAQNGEESIEIAKKNQPDIVLLDILMPGINGYEVCRLFKSMKELKSIPLVLVTIVNLDEDSLSKALEAGADAFLPKPIDPNNLKVLILNMLRIRDASKEIEKQTNALKEQFGDRIAILQEELEQHRRTESALAEKDLRSQILVDFAPQAIFQGNTDGSIVNANQKALEYTFYSKEEIIQLKMEDLFSEAEKLRVPLNYEALENGLVVNNDRIVTRKDGSVFPVRMSTKKLPDGSYVSFFRDISEDKKNIEAILQKDKILQAIAEASQALLIEDDLRGGINTALATIGNATSQDRVYIFEFHSLNDSDEIYMSQRFEWANKGISAQINNPELQNVRVADAAPRWYPVLSSGEILYGNIADFPEVEKQALSAQDIISILVVPVMIDGKCRGFLGFDNCHSENNWSEAEVSMLKAMASTIGLAIAKQRRKNELIKAKEKAEESDRLKTAFLTNISHEIRTPLNGILGFAGLLSEGNKTNDEVMHHSGLILKSGKRLLELINNIIHISKIEAGAEKFLKQPLSPALLVKEANEQFFAVAKNKRITLISSVPDELRNLQIKSDLSKLHQVLGNLISNAIKFTDNGTIETGFYLREQFLEFFVKDSGKGIAEEHQKKIFERFYQVDNSYSRGYEGAGLGLSLCKGIIEKLGGEIFVESEVGKGSKFIFAFPVNKIGAEDIRSENTNSIAKEEVNYSEKILIADDDPASLSIMQMMLQKQGYEVITCRNGLEAVNLFNQNSDIVLLMLDIKMPELDGFKTLDRIRAINPEIPAIAVTAHALSGDAFHILQAGFDDYIAKPFMKREVLSIIEKHFSGK